MTMMIKANEAECCEGMEWAEIRFQAVAKEAAKPKRTATVLSLKCEKQSPNPDNPTGRIVCSYRKVVGAS